jgi:hypothetical protein
MVVTRMLSSPNSGFFVLAAADGPVVSFAEHLDLNHPRPVRSRYHHPYDKTNAKESEYTSMLYFVLTSPPNPVMQVASDLASAGRGNLKLAGFKNHNQQP